MDFLYHDDTRTSQCSVSVFGHTLEQEFYQWNKENFTGNELKVNLCLQHLFKYCEAIFDKKTQPEH